MSKTRRIDLDATLATHGDLLDPRDLSRVEDLMTADEHLSFADACLAVDAMISCRRCQTQTRRLATRLCDPCWELERRIADRPEIAAEILSDQKEGADEEWADRLRRRALENFLRASGVDDGLAAQLAIWRDGDSIQIVDREGRTERFCVVFTVVDYSFDSPFVLTARNERGAAYEKDARSYRLFE